MTDGSVCPGVDFYEKYFLKWLACLPLSNKVTGLIPAACGEFGKNQWAEFQTRLIIGTESPAVAAESWTPSQNTRG